MCLMSYANNKGADQPAHLHSLISVFVVRCLDSIISRFYSQNFKTLASFCGCADRFASVLVRNSWRQVLSYFGSAWKFILLTVYSRLLDKKNTHTKKLDYSSCISAVRRPICFLAFYRRFLFNIETIKIVSWVVHCLTVLLLRYHDAQIQIVYMYLSNLVRLWYFSSSVNSFFKRACTAIQWG